MSGVICDRRVSARVNRKVYAVAARPTMLYGLETVALTKRQEAEMEVATVKMLRFSLGVTRSGMSTSEGLCIWNGLEKKHTRGKTEVVMVWTCTTEERCWVYWEKHAEDGATRNEETGEGLKGGLWMR